MKLATTCNKNEQKQNAKNKAESQIKSRQLGRTLRKLLDAAETGLRVLRQNL